jgi:hypothetical protein
MIGKKSVLLTLIGTVALGGGALLAADPPAPGLTPATPAVGDDAILGGPHAKPGLAVKPDGPLAELKQRLQILREAVGTLTLTDKEKADIKTMLQDAKGKLEEWRTANKDALDKIQADLKAARQAKDKGKVQEVLGQLKTLLETAPKPEFLKQLKGILAPEQFEKLIARLKELKEAGPTTQPAHPAPTAPHAHHVPLPPAP